MSEFIVPNDWRGFVAARTAQYAIGEYSKTPIDVGLIDRTLSSLAHLFFRFLDGLFSLTPHYSALRSKQFREVHLHQECCQLEQSAYRAALAIAALAQVAMQKTVDPSTSASINSDYHSSLQALKIRLKNSDDESLARWLKEGGLMKAIPNTISQLNVREIAFSTILAPVQARIRHHVDRARAMQYDIAFWGEEIERTQQIGDQKGYLEATEKKLAAEMALKSLRELLQSARLIEEGDLLGYPLSLQSADAALSEEEKLSSTLLDSTSSGQSKKTLIIQCAAVVAGFALGFLVRHRDLSAV